MPSSGAPSSRLTKKSVLANWDNVYQMYLRRDHVEAIIETWRELGGHAGFKEVVAGVAGAFVRVYTKSAESTVSGTYQLQRVVEMVPGKRPGNEIKLRIQGLERLVSVDKLSNKWPEEHELVVLQNKIQSGRLPELFESDVRATVTRLAVIQHCRLVKGGQDVQPITAERLEAISTYLREVVDDERRRMHHTGGTVTRETQQTSSDGDHTGTASEATEGRRRSARAGQSGSKRGRTDSSRVEAEAEKAEDDKQEEEAEANSQLTPQKRKPLGERKPIIAEMKARRVVSLNSLMVTAGPV